MDKLELIYEISRTGMEYHVDDFDTAADIIWLYFIDTEMFTEDELSLVIHLNGYSEKTLNDMLFVRFGYRDLLQFLESEISKAELYENKTLNEDVSIIDTALWGGNDLEEWARNDGWHLDHLIDLLVSEDWVWQELFDLIDGRTLTKTELNDFLRFDAEDIVLDLIGREFNQYYV